MKKRLIKFAVFCNRMCGQEVRALDFDDLLENRMTKKQKTFWSNVQFKDSQGRTINIAREFIDEQGMSFDEVFHDWIDNATQAELESKIHVI